MCERDRERGTVVVVEGAGGGVDNGGLEWWGFVCGFFLFYLFYVIVFFFFQTLCKGNYVIWGLCYLTFINQEVKCQMQ